MNQSNYSGLETGKYQSTGKLAEIARYLKVSAYWLATGKGAMALDIPDVVYDKIQLLNDRQQRLVVDFISEMLGDRSPADPPRLPAPPSDPDSRLAKPSQQ